MLLSRHIQVPIPPGVDFLPTLAGHVLGRDVSDGAVPADFGGALDLEMHQTPRIFQRVGCLRPGAFPVERFVPAFGFCRFRLGLSL